MIPKNSTLHYIAVVVTDSLGPFNGRASWSMTNPEDLIVNVNLKCHQSYFCCSTCFIFLHCYLDLNVIEPTSSTEETDLKLNQDLENVTARREDGDGPIIGEVRVTT